MADGQVSSGAAEVMHRREHGIEAASNTDNAMTWEKKVWVCIRDEITRRELLHLLGESEGMRSDRPGDAGASEQRT